MNSNKNYPKYSIIIGAYNTKKFLRLTLNSVLSQSYKNFELIIVDDGSTDGSDKLILQFAKKDSRIKPYFFKKIVEKTQCLKILEYKSQRRIYLFFRF